MAVSWQYGVYYVAIRSEKADMTRWTNEKVFVRAVAQRRNTLNSVFDIINVPLGYIFRWLYLLIGNYGWTIVAFTIVIKLAMFPLTLKQQKSMKKTQALQPKLAKIQEKYKYDQEKLNQETMKLYQETGVNPMGGCLPMLIQFPILIALYNIIRKPISYVMMLGQEAVMKIYEMLNGTAADNFARIDQIGLAKQMEQSMDKLGEYASRVINFDFLGIFDLSVTPSLQFISQNPIYAIIPIVAGGTTYLVNYVSTRMNGTANQDNPAASSMKMMNVMFPLMTAWFAITLPAGLGLYWTISNLFQILQMTVMNKYINVEVPADDDDGPKHFRQRKKKKK